MGLFWWEAVRVKGVDEVEGFTMVLSMRHTGVAVVVWRRERRRVVVRVEVGRCIVWFLWVGRGDGMSDERSGVY